MIRSMFTLLLTLCLMLPFSVYAHQSGGGGGNSDLQTACEISGGSWTGSASGNWACCWSDWGCYGCVDGHCKIKCTTQRCRKANAISKVSPGTERAKGLAPAGMKAPIVPKQSSKPAANSMQKMQE